jgi:xanthine dehydrogenase accessory factor
METADHEVLRAAAEWLEAGTGVCLVTLAAAFGSAPRPPGSLLALRDDGDYAGSLTGGCLEAELVRQLRAGELPASLPATVTYGLSAAEAGRLGLPCGGRLELVIERLASAAPVRQLLARIEAREQLVRRLCLDTGEASLHKAQGAAEFSWDGRNLDKLFGPHWRLLLIGAGQLSRFVAQIGLALDYEVIVCDPRAELAEHWRVDGAQLDTRMPDDAVRALAHGRCAVLALSHDPRLDDLALMQALAGEAFYVGALGSRRNNAQRRQRLIQTGVTPSQLARLHGPVGLPIGSRSPGEIAVAVLAGVTAARHGVTLIVAHDAPAAAHSAHV